MGMFECCHYCKPPKREPGCHAKCPEYLEAKAKYDELMAIEKQKHDVGVAIYSARSAKVRKAMNNLKKGRKYGQ